MTIADPAEFIRSHTVVLAPPAVPEMRLHLATELTPLWLATEEEMETQGLPPPYWAFCWPGGQALARHILDHPELVRGRKVLDFAAGGGVCGIAAALAGADRVDAAEIDGFSVAALRLNMALNDVKLNILAQDVIDQWGSWDVILAGDICYERALADRAIPWLRSLAARGVPVLLADPGRAYLPHQGLVELGRYAIPTSKEVEDREVCDTKVYRLMP
ncbi:methyltransferase [Telmatospirillum sp. J64-1]|uniref:class I SAM-dependent methyltransferase n=1 Tax=Telmatospirillum sp. J64-1 TaxID=2502183 RepID=UPI002103D8C0|nr:methyltransferase [Telmatospirillum sp. J64-1]